MTNATVAELYLEHAGLSKGAAAGVIRVLNAESGLRTTAEGEEGAYGIAQWLGSRRTGLEEYATGRGESVNNLQTQLDYLVKEIHERGELPGLERATSEKQAAELFVDEFERPKYPSEVLERAFGEPVSSTTSPTGGVTGNPTSPTTGASTAANPLSTASAGSTALKDLLYAGLLVVGAAVVWLGFRKSHVAEEEPAE